MTPLAPRRLSIGQAWTAAGAQLRTDARILLPVALLFFALPALLFGWAVPNPAGARTSAAAPLLQLLVFVAALIGQAALARLTLAGGVRVGEAIRGALRRLPVMVGLFLAAVLLIVAALMVVSFVMLLAGMDAASLDRMTPGQKALIGLTALALAGYAIPRLLLVPALAMLAPTEGLRALGRRASGVARGNRARLFATFLLGFLLSFVLAAAVGAVLGTIVRLAGLEIAPWSLGAFVIAIGTALVQVPVGTAFSLLYAQLARQAAG